MDVDYLHSIDEGLDVQRLPIRLCGWDKEEAKMHDGEKKRQAQEIQRELNEGRALKACLSGPLEDSRCWVRSGSDVGRQGC